MVRCKRMPLSQALAFLKSASTTSSIPALKLFAFGKYSMGYSITSKLSGWVIFGHPTKRIHMVISDSTRIIRTGTPSRNQSFVRCNILIFHKFSKKFRMSMFDYTNLPTLRVYVRRCSGSTGNRTPLYISTPATSNIFSATVWTKRTFSFVLLYTFLVLAIFYNSVNNIYRQNACIYTK